MLIRIIMSLDPVLVKDKDTKSVTHSLIDNWVLWAHLPHNTDWSLKSYIKIYQLDQHHNNHILNHNSCHFLIYYKIKF